MISSCEYRCENMAEQYKLMHKTADLSEILGTLSQRLASIEGRLDAIEEKLHGKKPEHPAVVPPVAFLSVAPSTSAARSNNLLISQAALSVSGSSTPTSVSSASRELMLAPADEQIVNLIRAKGAVCAEEVRGNFRYKGKNAASARLNRLFELGILEKQQAGRVVYYRLRTA